MADVDANDVLEALKPLLTRAPTTANRLRQRISVILAQLDKGEASPVGEGPLLVVPLVRTQRDKWNADAIACTLAADEGGGSGARTGAHAQFGAAEAV